MKDESPPLVATAPVRLDLAGGWTDVPPFSAVEGGAVVNTALTLRVRAEFRAGGSGILVQADDLNQAFRVTHPADLTREGPLVLHRAALRMFPTSPGTLRTRSDVPPGSGLGSSGALDVALVSVLAAARGDPLEPVEVAAQAVHLERIEAGLAGGSQDQYAAALGGWHRLTFRGEAVGVERLELEPAFQAELERRLVICYTGQSRVSGRTIARVMDAYAAGAPGVVAALRELAGLAADMAAVLRASDLAAVGDVLTRNWRAQERLDPEMATPEMRTLEAAMTAAGALGGKAAGAGAGGCMFFVMGGDPEAGRDAARRVGATVLTAGFSVTGVEQC